MAIEEYDGVIINKVTLAKYKELKAAGSLVTSQTYVITDLDDNLYWQLRVGKVIPTVNNFIFYNPNSIDMSSLPTNEVLMTHKGQNNIEWNFKIIYEESQYVLKMIKRDNTYSSVIASGTMLNSMSFRLQYSAYGESAYGSFNKITYIHPLFLSIIDNIMRINNCDF